jgi:uncharacterized integral membrane protein (TIGR00698 family)
VRDQTAEDSTSDRSRPEPAHAPTDAVNALTMPLPLSRHLRISILVACVVLCATTWLNPPAALLLGFVFSQFVGHPFKEMNSRATNIFLKCSVVGLGFGLNASTAIEAGQRGLWLTVLFLVVTIVLGLLIGDSLGMSRKTSHLLASGTAICGGSAVAAIASVIDASEDEISVSLATIFLLNAVGLLIFPVAGHYYGLTQQQFGLWAAVALHDTSSVVGAASVYGDRALETATTLKLARTLWIVPVAFWSALVFRTGRRAVALPWFIVLFILAMLANTYVALAHQHGSQIVLIAKTGLTITLFLIGAGLSLDRIRAVGWRALVLGVLLWMFVSLSSFLVIRGI